MRCCARVFIERLSQEPVVNTCRTGNPVRIIRSLSVSVKTDRVTDVLDLLPNSNMTLCGDSLYVYSTEWSWITNKNTITYAIVDTKTKRVVSRNFIRDGTDKTIQIPYGVAVNLDTREIFVTDAKDYVTPGTPNCFDPDGKRNGSSRPTISPRTSHSPTKITAARIIAQRLRPVKQSRAHPPDRKTRQRSNGRNRKKIFADRIVFFPFF